MGATDDTRRTPGWGRRPFRILPIAMTLLVSAAAYAIPPTDAAPSIDASGKYLVVRCLFREHRLVLRYSGKLFVLHEGDVLPDSDLRVESFAETRVVLSGRPVIRGGGEHPAPVPDSLVIINLERSGKLRVDRFSAQPEPGQLSAPLIIPISTVRPTASPPAPLPTVSPP